MWSNIKNAVASILSGAAKRVDGNEWTAYAVGSNVIRIDLKVDKLSPSELDTSSSETKERDARPVESE